MHFDGGNTDKLYKEYVKRRDGIVFTGKQTSRIHRKLSHIVSCYQNHIPPDEPAYSSILYESLIILLFAREDAEPNEEDSIVEQAKRYIQRNISDNLTIQSVSQSMGLSSSYFSRLFKRETGYSHVPVPANEFLLLQA